MTAVTVTAQPRRRSRRLLGVVAEHAVLIALGAMFLVPLVFVVATALMSDQQALTGALFPHPVRWRNFADVFAQAPILRYLLNTVLYAGLATVGMLLSSYPAAYAMARIRWRGSVPALIVVLAMMMVPQQVLAVPLYVMWAKLHLVATLVPLVAPFFFGNAFSIFLLRQFLLTIPDDYADAARVDGCGELRVMVSIVGRMAKPAIAAACLFNFLSCWNSLFNPLLYVGGNPTWWTISIGLTQFKSLHAVNWNLTMAATVVFTLPIIVLFFFAQRAFVEGANLTGIKG